ncbi:hypothetical protein D3C85_1902250 [compost metagenome]
MVKQIMERFGGKVSLTSRENEGTSVRLSFMVAEPMQEAPEAEPKILRPNKHPA